MPATKIATCCYCGTRAALRLRGAERHELSCSSCGAPLHELKMMPLARAKTAKPTGALPRQIPGPNRAKPQRSEPRKPKRRRNRKGLFRKIVEEVWDEIEDIFD